MVLESEKYQKYSSKTSTNRSNYLLTRIFKGYKTLLQDNSKTLLTLIKMILFLIFVIILSSLVVYPLWYTATNNPSLYSRIILILIISLPFLYLAVKLINGIKEYGFKESFNLKVLPKLKRISIILIQVLLLFLSIYLINFNLIVGIMSIIVWLIVYGFIKFNNKS